MSNPLGRGTVNIGTGGGGASGGLTDTELRATPVPVSVTGGGDATAANQTTGNTSLASIKTDVDRLDIALSALRDAIVGAGPKTLTDVVSALGALTVSISGSVAVTNATAANLKVDPSAVTSPISAVSLPLPTSAATSTKQSDGTQKTQIVDGSGNVGSMTSNAVDVNIKSGSIANTGFLANAGTNLNTSLLALEAGHLATIDTSTAKIPSQGQALAAASLPVVLTAAQITTLTPPVNTGYALDATLTSLDTTALLRTLLRMEGAQLLALSAQPTNGFIPSETLLFGY